MQLVLHEQIQCVLCTSLIPEEHFPYSISFFIFEDMVYSSI